MNNFVTCVLALTVSLGTTAMLATHYPGSQRGLASESRLALDGAYRDGLYVGKLAAESGRPSRPPIGRWSDEKDRASFLAGYERTYDARSSQPPYAKSEF
jgi:hypothetical protein